MRLFTRLSALALLAAAFSVPAAAQPDLRVFASLEENDQQAEPGDRITIEYTAQNLGNQDVEDATVGFYLSTDDVWDSGDDLLETESLGTDLEAGETEDENEQVPLPSSVPDGNYFIIVVMDPFDSIAETDETNNTDADAIVIGDPGGTPDFRITSLTLDRSTVEVGGTVVADYRVANEGDGFADESYPGIYLSSDAALSGDDRFLRADFTDGIAAGSSKLEDAIIDIPSDVPAGDYFLIIAADYENRVTELDESNNTRSAALTVTPGSTPTSVGEAGTVVWDLGGERSLQVSLGRSYSSPVVVVGGISYNDPEPALARVGNVQDDAFGARVDEWDYQDGDHAAERLHYLVMEEGVHTLADGRRVEAGFVQANRRGRALVTFSTPFAERPVVLSQVIGDPFQPEGPPTVTRHRTRTDRARIELVREEASTAPFGGETVAWIAIEAGPGGSEGHPFEAGYGSRAYSSQPRRVFFDGSVGDDAVFLAAVQSVAEEDPVVVRLLQVRSVSADVFLQEETSADAETTHGRERLGYAVFAPGLIQAASGAAPVAASLKADGPAPALAVTHYPNPVRRAARVEFSLPEAGSARLEVFDVTGRRVAVLAEGSYEAGPHEIALQVGTWPAGVYLYRLQSAGGVATGRLTVVR